MPTSSSRPRTRVGVWLIGARGSVATTVVAGRAAVTAGPRRPTGMVTETPRSRTATSRAQTPGARPSGEDKEHR